MNRDPEQTRLGATIGDTEKEQAKAKAMSPKQAAVLELAQAFHTDMDQGV